MAWHQEIFQPDGETIVTECGPMVLSIKAFAHGAPQVDTARKAAGQAVQYLERIAQEWGRLGHPAQQMGWVPEDRLVRRMVASAKAIGDADLTPMAAVAGTLADAVADWLVEQGMTQVIVDNGGDLAVRLGSGETVTVGIRTDVRSGEITHRLGLDERRSSWGVTTSGLGGRSFTRGIASAVTTLATTAARADAAATALANACYVDDPAIRQVPARLLDPNTDIPDVAVTVQVGDLSEKKLSRAVDHARMRARELEQRGLIIGALVAAGSQAVITDGLASYILPGAM